MSTAAGQGPMNVEGSSASSSDAPLIGEPLGRVTGPSGISFSARLNKDRAKEIVNASINSAAIELSDAELSKVISDIEKELEAKSGKKGGAKSKKRGGDGETEGGPDRATKMERLKAAMGALFAYAARETGPIGTSARALAMSTGRLAQEAMVRVPVTLTVLTVSGGTLTANFLASLFSKFNQWGRDLATKNEDPATAEAAAVESVKDLESIARTTAVGGLILNQLGILPLSVVLTVILYALRVNFATETGRSLLISQFYTWYIVQPPNVRDKLKTDAEAYAAEAKAMGGKAVENAGALATTLLKAGESGKNAFQIIKDAAMAAGVKEVKVPADATKEVEGAARAVVAVVQNIPNSSSSSSSSSPAAAVGMPPPSSSSSSSSSSSNAAPLITGGPPSSSILRRRPLVPPAAEPERSVGRKSSRGTDSDISSTERSPVSTRPVTRGMAPAVSPATKRKGGKRKTVRKIKRRVTRRKPKMPTFVY